MPQLHNVPTLNIRKCHTVRNKMAGGCLMHSPPGNENSHWWLHVSVKSSGIFYITGK